MFDIITQKIRVVLLENLFDSGLITSDLVIYVQHIDGVWSISVPHELVEELCVLISDN